MTATSATCPRCGDWTLEILDVEGEVCECDGPFGCGYTWDPSEPTRPDLVLEIERMAALIEELPPDYWPTWVHFLMGERMRDVESEESEEIDGRAWNPWAETLDLTQDERPRRPAEQMVLFCQ